MKGVGWREEGGGWRMEGGGWRVEGSGWRVKAAHTYTTNLAHVRQSRPDSALGFLVKSSKPFKSISLHSDAGQGSGV